MKNQEQEWLLQEKYDGVESEAFRADCARLAAGEPLGYVIGQVPFLDCQIWLDSHPLIPRPETEYWVEQAIKAISNLPNRTNILDLCAGSGAIGVAVAKAIPEAHVTFAELDPAHLPTIEKNLNKNITKPSNPMEGFEGVLGERFVVVESDLFSRVPIPEAGFDFIFSNPPYIDKEAQTVEDSVANHEPHLALFGGHDGMELIERIIAEARAKLALPTPSTPEGGQLWIEHEPFQSQAITKLANKHNFICTTHQDQYDVPRYSILTVA